MRDNGPYKVTGPVRLIDAEGGEYELPPGDSIVLVDVQRVSDSCGYGVPLMEYQGERPHVAAWADKKLRVGGPDARLDYQREKNARSIDGLPAVDVDSDWAAVDGSVAGAPVAGDAVPGI